ncbi:MAG TPA: hypothetical protein PK280_05405 [Planctomycetota bacterium]|nr:hypothetical protein [Planctomycetota bacterium]
MEAPGTIPRPLGGPEPLDKEGGMTLVGFMTMVLVASGALIFVGTGLTTRTHGASRSARLRHQERQRAVAEAVRQIEAARAAGEAGREPGGE